MFYRHLKKMVIILGALALAGFNANVLALEPLAGLSWSTVVNNGDLMPTSVCNPEISVAPPCRTFNSYNQPSVNANKMVVIRARSRGGQGLGQPVHGVYVRNMANNGPVQMVFDRNTLVPEPNNLDTLFVEPPSFPRIDMRNPTIASRANHKPVWEYTLPDGSDTRAGTTGIYTNPFGRLVTGASKLGAVPEFSYFQVPEFPGTPFDVFPGAPAVTNDSTIVFKGNYTVNNIGKTGVYYRRLGEFNGGTSPVILIANNTHTLIPGTNTKFGSTAPPSAASNKAVFTGLDNEEKPTAGGIYLAPLTPYKLDRQPKLKTLVGIGSSVPGESSETHFTLLGEGLSYDGRFVSFWGAWGTNPANENEGTKEVKLYCPEEGNQARIEYCKAKYQGYIAKVPVHQGIFVYDTVAKKAFRVAKTGSGADDFADFLYWNFSGKAPGVGEGEEGDDGELARWRSAAFSAVSGSGDKFQVAFKARQGNLTNQIYVDIVDGIYLAKGPRAAVIQALLQTGWDGTVLDPEAVDDSSQALPVTELGIERDGFRKRNLVINASMGSEETGWAGVYLTRVPKP